MMPPIGYYGAKTRLAERIAALLPAHGHYVEPFAGSLAVLLAKPPSHMETVNDLDGDLMTFWRVLRDLRPDLYALAAAAPLGDTAALDTLTEAAREAAAASAGSNLGTALHKFTERHDRGEHIEPPAPWDADLAAYAATMTAAGITISPAHIERITPVPDLGVAGTLDRIAAVPGHGMVIADVKTAQDLRYSWGEIAIQLAIYAHGAGLWTGTGYDPMPPVRQDRALVIHLPAGQARCDLHWIDLQAGWDAAQLAAQARAWRCRRDLAEPFTAGEAAA
jgi:hypothetical protein